MAYAEVNYAALGLAAYGARSDLSWPRADLSLRPISNSGRTQRWLRLQANTYSAIGVLRMFAPGLLYSRQSPPGDTRMGGKDVLELVGLGTPVYLAGATYWFFNWLDRNASAQ